MATMISTIIATVVLSILSLTDVNSQACNNAAQYSSCSSNSGCGCLSYSFSDTMGVCGLLSQSCSEFVACQSPNDACAQTGYVCVRHPQCSSSPLCFPSSMFHEDVCPPVIVSNFSTALDTTDGIYRRPGGSSSNHYYEAIQIVVNRTGTYNLSSLSGIDTHGHLYNGTFYPHDPSTNLAMTNDDAGANNQFGLTAFLEAGVPYTLVVSAHNYATTGPYSVIAAGPGDAQFTRIDPFYLTTTTTTTTLAPVITSNYANLLTINSGNYTRYGISSGSFYYHAIEVRVPVTGSYTFRTSSTIGDTFGYLYQGNFYPTYPQYNIIAQDDDTSGNNQFGITATLRSDVTYILVFTTYSPGATGSFDVVTSGPSNVYMNHINI